MCGSARRQSAASSSVNGARAAIFKISGAASVRPNRASAITACALTKSSGSVSASVKMEVGTSFGDARYGRSPNTLSASSRRTWSAVWLADFTNISFESLPLVTRDANNTAVTVWVG
jgi:hypothetical protein